jgi:hypothetical protein
MGCGSRLSLKANLLWKFSEITLAISSGVQKALSLTPMPAAPHYGAPWKTTFKLSSAIQTAGKAPNKQKCAEPQFMVVLSPIRMLERPEYDLSLKERPVYMPAF